MAYTRGESLQERASRELAKLAAQFAAAETELVDTYYNNGKRTQQTDAHWSKKQSGRELESAVTSVEKLMAHWQAAKNGEVTFDRRWFEEELWRGTQEMNHANVYLDYFEGTTGETADCAEIYRRFNRWDPDPSSDNISEWMKLAELFKQQEKLAEKDPAMELVAANGLLEGGSCGLFYALSKINGEERDVRLAEGNKNVLRDERGHGPANVYWVPELIKTEADLETVKKHLIERGKQRLRMRNEQFSFPISEERIEQMAAGDVDLGPVAEIWGEDLYKEYVARA